MNKINVKVAILNNGCLGMVRQWQEMFYGKRFSASNLTCGSLTGVKEPSFSSKNKERAGYIPDFVKVAEAYGAVGIRISSKKGVVPTLKKALKINRPVIMEFMVEPGENVLPMVPAGHALDEIITSYA